MRPILVGALLATLAGCGGRSNVQCETDSNCDLSGGGKCVGLVSGDHWCAYPDPQCPNGYRFSNQNIGDGVAGQCVPNALDAGTDAPKDATTDAPPDAPLNCPSTAPVQNGQAADLELGQPGFTSGSANNPSLSGSTLSTTVGVSTDSNRLWVSDSGNARVLQWNSFPAVNGQSASIAIGQPNLISSGGSTTQSGLDVGGGFIARAGTKLVVSDGSNNRVLIWSSVPTTSGQPADIVLGQQSFTTKVSGNSASSLEGPTGVWTDGTKLIVADRFNNRVLIWNSFPTSNGAPADVVLGASGFGMTPSNTPPTASSFKAPYGVFVHANRLFVADSGNQRVLIWNTIPTANNAPADVVLGQTAFDAYFNNAGAPYPQVNAIGMAGPSAVFVDDCNSLYVCDAFNGRVMVFTTVPTQNGKAADAVLGKPDLMAQPNASTPPSAQWMGGCSGLAVGGTNLFVGDSTRNRVLRFGLSR